MGGCIEATKRPLAYYYSHRDGNYAGVVACAQLRKSVNTPNTTAVQTKIILLHAFGIDISNDTPDIHICNSKMIKIVKLRIVILRAHVRQHRPGETTTPSS